MPKWDTSLFLESISNYADCELHRAICLTNELVPCSLFSVICSLACRFQALSQEEQSKQWRMNISVHGLQVTNFSALIDRRTLVANYHHNLRYNITIINWRIIAAFSYYFGFKRGKPAWIVLATNCSLNIWSKFSKYMYFFIIEAPHATGKVCLVLVFRTNHTFITLILTQMPT
jgi:hypothetical protein